MTRSTDIRDRHVAGCGQPDPEPTLWMTNGPLIRENKHAETSRTSVESACGCQLGRRA
jgi:hypothetical protein